MKNQTLFKLGYIFSTVMILIGVSLKIVHYPFDVIPILIGTFSGVFLLVLDNSLKGKRIKQLEKDSKK